MRNAESEGTGGLFVMCRALDNEEFPSVARVSRIRPNKFINQPVFFVDSAAPIALPIAKRLRFADTGIPVAFNVLNEKIDAFQYLPVFKLPTGVFHAMHAERM